MTEYAIVKDDVVIDRIVSNKKFADAAALKIGGKAINDENAQKGFIKTGSTFAAPPEDFDTVKERMLSKVENVAYSLIRRGIEFNGDQIPITEKTLRSINGVRGNNIQGKKIKISRSKIVNYSQQQISTLQSLLESRVEEIENSEIQLTELVNSATSIEELSNIDINSM